MAADLLVRVPSCSVAQLDRYSIANDFPHTKESILDLPRRPRSKARYNRNRECLARVAYS